MPSLITQIARGLESPALLFQAPREFQGEARVLAWRVDGLFLPVALAIAQLAPWPFSKLPSDFLLASH